MFTSVVEDEEGQAVVIPPEMAFVTEEVSIWRDAVTGEVHLAPLKRPASTEVEVQP